jgi:hypothetical protein
MTDKTTEGITAEPEEVEAVLLNLCGYHLSESDPVFRYTVLTREQVLYDALVTAIKRERGRALAELVANGHKLTEVAELTGLGSRQRVQRLIQLAKVEQAVAEVQAASRDFDERLAAVEATLDEVVSGFIPVVANEPEVSARVNEDFDEVVVFAKDELDNEVFAKDGFGQHEFGQHEFGQEEIVKDDEDTSELNLPLTALNEPTQVVPTFLRTSHDVEIPWWRRSA